MAVSKLMQRFRSDDFGFDPSERPAGDTELFRSCAPPPAPLKGLTKLDFDDIEDDSD